MGEEEEKDDGMEMIVRLGAAKDPEGSAWDVTICKPGFTMNGWYIPDETLRDAAEAKLFEGVDVNLYELPQGASHVPDALFDLKSLLVKNKVGLIDQVKHAAGVGLQGVLHFLDSAKWLGKNLVEAMKAGQSVYGLSYDCPVRAKKDEVEGKTVFKVLKFLRADSVDVVTRPAAGGKFNRAVAARQAQNKGETMDKKKLWDLITEKRPDLLKDKIFEKIAEDELLGLARMAMEPPSAATEGGKKEPTDKKLSVPQDVLTKDDLALFRCEMALDKTLDKSGLPEHSQKRIRALFKGIFKQEDLDKEIGAEKDMLAKMSQPQPVGVASGAIVVGIGTLEKAQLALDKAFGLTKDDLVACSRMTRLDKQPFFEDRRSVQDVQDFDNIPAFSGLREMYAFFTGDHEVNGVFNRKALAGDLRARMDINSATFTYLLGNTLGRRMVRDYMAADFQENILISIRKPVRDFRAQEAVNVGYFPDLSTVDPEAANYVEIAPVTDEELSYTVGQKGNILTVTRKTIINDDLSMVQRLVGRLGRAARRTHAKYVWGFFINNSTCADATAWFTSTHGNLATGALTQSTAQTAYIALAKMTEKDSSERIAWMDPSVKPTLIYPPDLFATGWAIVEMDSYFTGNDLTTKVQNPLYKKVNGAMISLFTDTTDWGLIMPASMVDLVEMGYLNGREEPEMFLADSPQSEQVFVADKIRYKIRHEYAGGPVDYRGAYKAVV